MSIHFDLSLTKLVDNNVVRNLSDNTMSTEQRKDNYLILETSHKYVTLLMMIYLTLDKEHRMMMLVNIHSMHLESKTRISVDSQTMKDAFLIVASADDNDGDNENGLVRNF